MKGFSLLKEIKHYLSFLTLLISLIALGIGSYNTYLISTRVESGRALAPTQKAKEMSEKEIQSLIKSGAPVLGNPNAKVTIVEFADFQCPFCGKYFKEVIPAIKSKFIDTGLVKFIHMDFAFLGEESLLAAMAANCAKDQGKFWEYHDYLYEHQQGENRGAFEAEKLKVFAKDLSLDSAVFAQCLDSRKYEKKVNENTALGQSFDVKGTPATFINNFFIPGLQDSSYFINRIEAALK